MSCENVRVDGHVDIQAERRRALGIDVVRADDAAVGPTRAGIDAVADVAGNGQDIGIRNIEDVDYGKREAVGAGIGRKINLLDAFALPTQPACTPSLRRRTVPFR